MKQSRQKATEFHAAEGWPISRVSSEAKGKAVQALLANHTLIVGQSRSGKTNAARRVVEEILAWTEARVVILDPNADFKYLKELSTGSNNQGDKTDPLFVARWRQINKQIGVAAPDGTIWGIDWGKLSLEEMAAFLRLKPSETFAEYRHLDHHFKYQKQTKEWPVTLDQFSKSKYFDVAVGEDVERYRLRLQELAGLNVWAKDSSKDLDSLFAKDYRSIIVDLSLDDDQVRTLTAARALEALWSQGEERRKVFLRDETTRWDGTVVVIDEGHLFAPPDTTDPQKRLVSEKIQRFADQGKKLNLYLMVITQQPGKVHPSVLSEFNNRIILRVNERRSLSVLEETYGGSRGRYDGALTFEPGEALIEGALLRDESPPASLPRGVRFKLARTREGGGTPKADWALPRSQ
jgi:DNA helicase HerA-like ATPase